MRIGVYPGTFDPVTIGHLDIIHRASLIVDKLIIGVAKNVSKDVFFDSELRAEMIKNSIKDSPKNIEVVTFDGLLVEFVMMNNSKLIIRGLRAVSDFDYEFKMSWINHRLEPMVETIFLTASQDTQFISSNFVKEIVKLGGSIDEFVPQRVVDEYKKYYRR